MSGYITNYEEAAEVFCRIPRFNSDYSLENIKRFLGQMGQPDRQMKIVHIAGTNGKGSTAVYLAGLLEQAGLKVGLFTSPHLVDIRERFRINGQMISKELFTEAVQYVLNLLRVKEQDADELETTYMPCFFDMTFFVGMYVFYKEKVDILVLETGLGGRLDATNAVENKVLTLITHIGLDHTEYLGDTTEAIAEEKAGIMQAEVPCIIAPRNDGVAHIFIKKAEELGCSCRIIDKADYACQGVYEKSVAFSYFSRYYGTVPIKLNTSAVYQVENVSLALAGFETLIDEGILAKQSVPIEKLKQSLCKTQWAGRMEEVAERVFLDGAHNMDGIEAFLASVEADNCIGQRTVIFSAVRDKDYSNMLSVILESGLFSQMVVTRIAGERGVLAEVLFEEACRHRELQKNSISILKDSDVFSAIHQVFTNRKQFDCIYIVGSLYLVGQVKAELVLSEKNATEQI